MCHSPSSLPRLDARPSDTLELPSGARRSAACLASDTAIVDGEIKQVSLADYKGKYVILFFYPKDFT